MQHIKLEVMNYSSFSIRSTYENMKWNLLSSSTSSTTFETALLDFFLRKDKYDKYVFFANKYKLKNKKDN